jgi:hypothetical protein
MGGRARTRRPHLLLGRSRPADLDILGTSVVERVGVLEALLGQIESRVTRTVAASAIAALPASAPSTSRPRRPSPEDDQVKMVCAGLLAAWRRDAGRPSCDLLETSHSAPERDSPGEPHRPQHRLCRFLQSTWPPPRRSWPLVAAHRPAGVDPAASPPRPRPSRRPEALAADRTDYWPGQVTALHTRAELGHGRFSIGRIHPSSLRLRLIRRCNMVTSFCGLDRNASARSHSVISVQLGRPMRTTTTGSG